MKAIIIRPKTQTVVLEEIDGSLESLQKLVGGYIEVVHLPNGDDLYINDEGRINGTTDFFGLHGQIFAGIGVILSHDKNGDVAEPNSTLLQIKKLVRM